MLRFLKETRDHYCWQNFSVKRAFIFCIVFFIFIVGTRLLFTTSIEKLLTQSFLIEKVVNAVFMGFILGFQRPLELGEE